MARPTAGALGLSPVLAEHPVLAAYVAGMAVMLVALAAVALARPRTFAAVLDDAAIASRTDRRLLLGALIVMWSAGWPICVAVIAARAVRRR